MKIRKRITFSELYNYHIDKYKDLITKEQINLEDNEEKIILIKKQLINNELYIYKYFGFEILPYFDKEEPLETRSVTQIKLKRQVNRFVKVKKNKRFTSDELVSVNFLHSKIIEFYNTKLAIFESKDKIVIYKTYLIDFSEFKDIWSNYKRELERNVLEGNDVELSPTLGIVGIYRVKNEYTKNSRASHFIKWGDTMKTKQAIIDSGKTPYNKQEHIEAIEKGENYDGIKYFVFKDELYSYSLQWYNKRFKHRNRYILENTGKDNFKELGTWDEIANRIKESGDIEDVLDLPARIQVKRVIMSKAFPHLDVRYIKEIRHNKFLQELNKGNYLYKSLSKRNNRELDKYRND